MRVGIVGAGFAGFGAARTLKASGHESVIFEKSRAVGGRVATRRLGGFTFDTGASSIAPRGMALEEAMLHELDTTDLIHIEKPIFTHSALRVFPGDAAKSKISRYTYGPGNNRLAKLMAEGLDVRLETAVEELARDGKGFRIGEEAFDALVLTAPIPQTSTLLWSLEESRPIANVRYRPCLSVLLGFDTELPAQHYHALLDVEQRHPLTWLSIESQKSPGRAPVGGTALVAQMSPSYSLNFYRRSDAEIVEDVVTYIHRLYGTLLGQPVVSDVKRWKYSQPDSVALFDTVNPPGSRLVIAGDGVVGGRTENAYRSGVLSASLLMAEV